MLMDENFSPGVNIPLRTPISPRQIIESIHGPEVIMDAKIYALAF